MPAKHTLHAGALALAVTGVLVWGAAAAAAHPKERDDPLRVGAREVQTQFLDLGAPGPTLGDQTVFSERLSLRGREAGTSGGVCTVTGATPPYRVLTAQCVVSLSLRRGQITLQGLIETQGPTDPGPFRLAITGGTGAYSGAEGTARFRRVTRRRGVYTLRIETDGEDRGGHHRKRRH